MTQASPAAHAATATETIVAARDVARDFAVGGGTVHALRGRSGSGKTTLLNILTGLDDPTSGAVTVLGHDLTQMDETARARLRRASIGMMFQNAHLFPLLTAQENVEVPMRLAKADRADRARRSLAMLERVGLGPRAHHRGLELSGGEQQRVALARALVHTPRFVVADEPTGNLDSMTGRDIVSLLRDTAHSLGVGFLVATHDMTVVSAADRVLRISDGLLTDES